jgi:hypothetical protein
MSTSPFSYLTLARTKGENPIAFNVPYISKSGQIIAHRYNTGERTPPMFPRGESSATLILDITRGLQGTSPKYVVMKDCVVRTPVKDAEGNVTGEVVSLPDNILEKLKAKVMAIPVKNSDHTEDKPSISYPWRLATPEETLSAKDDGMDAALVADLNSVLSAHGLAPRSSPTAQVAAAASVANADILARLEALEARNAELEGREQARLEAERKAAELAAFREQVKAELLAELNRERVQTEKVQAEQKEMADLRAENARLKAAKKGTGSTPE